MVSIFLLHSIVIGVLSTLWRTFRTEILDARAGSQPSILPPNAVQCSSCLAHILHIFPLRHSVQNLVGRLVSHRACKFHLESVIGVSA